MTAVSPPGTAFVKAEFASQSGTGSVFFDNAVLTNSTTAAPYTPPVRIQALGDSITWGQGAAGGYRLPLYQLLAGAGYSVDFVGTQTGNGAPGLPDSDHEGYPGYRIDQITSGFLSWINAVPDPDLILLLIGTNDYGQNYDIPNATNRLDQPISLIATTRPYAKVVVANLILRTDNASLNTAIQTTFNPYVPEIDARHAALGRDVYFLNLYPALGASDLVDGLHPNQSGYNKMGASWFGAVTNLITPLGTTNPPAVSRAVGGAAWTNVVVTFSKPVSSSSATNLANYSLDGGLTILNATLEPAAQRDVTLVTSPQTPGTLYTLSITNVQDITPSHLPVAPGTMATFRAVPPNTTPPVIGNLYPSGAELFQFTNALGFTASSANGIATNGIAVTLDGVNASGLVLSGSATSWNVSYPNLPVNTSHVAAITVMDVYGNTASATVTFDTFRPTYYTWEAEDYDFSGGQYFDNPQTGAYANLPATAGVDFQDVNSGGTYVYRPSGTATEITADLARAQFAGTTDYNIGFFGVGEWGNYTRHFPVGTYAVWGRFAAGGGGETKCYLGQVISGFGTASQATNILGTFNIANSSWTTFTWAPLVDTNGALARLTFNGATTTLRLARPAPGTGLPDVNVNFLMLVPSASPVRLTASNIGGTVAFSFPTQTGLDYQVQHTTDLRDTLWAPLGSPVPGNDEVQSVSDPIGPSDRFFRLQSQ